MSSGTEYTRTDVETETKRDSGDYKKETTVTTERTVEKEEPNKDPVVIVEES
jgi:hypothetical protein